jgi:hypothetical protein
MHENGRRKKSAIDIFLTLFKEARRADVFFLNTLTATKATLRAEEWYRVGLSQEGGNNLWGLGTE